ncbi:MAG TPA: hypothetical protein VFI02_05975 [Armatimonadota bacterium]|nr:hypothetical protein [Armatimonadota bacterium]
MRRDIGKGEALDISRFVAVPRNHRIHELIWAAEAVARCARLPSFDKRPYGGGDDRLDLVFSVDNEILDGERFNALSCFGVIAEEQVEPNSVILNPESDELALTYVHELGHCLDYYRIEPYGVFSSRTDRLFARWRGIVAETEAVRMLRRVIANPWAVFIDENDNPVGEPARLDCDFYQQLASWHELWARSFAQYIVTREKTGFFRRKDRFLRGLLSNRVNNPENSIEGLFWTDDDFERVYECVDEIVRKVTGP